MSRGDRSRPASTIQLLSVLLILLQRCKASGQLQAPEPGQWSPAEDRGQGYRGQGLLGCLCGFAELTAVKPGSDYSLQPPNKLVMEGTRSQCSCQGPRSQIEQLMKDLLTSSLVGKTSQLLQTSAESPPQTNPV